MRVRFFFPLLIILAAAAAACGGGGGNGSVIPSATATPHEGPTSVPVGPTPQVVDLSGGGYTLQFTVPPIVTGTTATMSASLQTTLPSGTTAPQSSKHGEAVPRNPIAPDIGANVKGLVYLVVSTTATVGFSSAPGFQFTMPSGTTISNGQSAYLLFWDPYLAGSTGWVALLGPGAVSGQVVTFPSVQTGVNLNANTQYIYALAVTSAPVPTATPAPTPTPTVAPSSTPSLLPAYCSSYSTPVPNANSSPQPVWFTDNSGTGAQVYLYVVSGAPPGGGVQTQYLAANGTMTNFTSGATAPPIPLECFPGSTHQGNGLTFELPPPTNANQSENLYIAYATPMPGDSSPPNPLQFVGQSNGGNTQPALDWNAAGYATAPFDYVEFTLPYGITDVTQVDKVGLPLQVTQGNSTIGFASGQYDLLLSDILSDPTYSKLAVSTQLNGRNVLARVLSPANGEDWGFPQDWWYNSTFSGTYSAGGKGYVGYVLSKYQTAPQLYTLNGIAGESGYYCATSDGAAYVEFYQAASASCSPLSTTLTYKMDIKKTLEGTNTGTDSYGVCQSAIFSMPYGGPTGTVDAIPNTTDFYLWKALVIDMARGVALQSGTHPIGGWDTSPPAPAPLSDFYLDPVFNKYAYLVHKHMINNDSYALQYDEPGGLAPTFNSDPSKTLQITVWNIPAYNRTVPTATATPLPCP